MTQIKINAVQIYHPSNLVTNDFYVEHFKKKGRNVEKFLTDVLGRNERYIVSEDENTLTMGIEAAKRALAAADLTGKDIDLIVFATQVPEYNMPTNAMFVHAAIGSNERTLVLDLNANCAGMTVAVEVACRYMQANPRVNRALVVGADANSLIYNPEQEITYGNLADSGAAVILEKTEENTGFIDALYSVDSSYRENFNYPQKGFSKTIGKQDHILFTPFDTTANLIDAIKTIDELLETNGLTINDVDAFCLSQFALSNVDKLQEHYLIEKEKIVFVGHKYGYTASNSPLMCLYEGVETGRIKRGDTVLFWTIGAGHEMVAMLFKY